MSDHEPAGHQISAPNSVAIAPPPRRLRVREQSVRMTHVAQVIGGLDAIDAIDAKDPVEILTPDDEKPTVLIVDDDPDIRESLQRLLRTVGLDSRAFASPSKFIKSKLPNQPTCLVLDVRLPGRSGLDFQRELTTANVNLPIIFITGHADVPMAVQAMKAGAIEFLIKPFRDQDLLDAIQLGLARDRARCERESELTRLVERFGMLTLREREVMAHVVNGRLNKQIANLMGISEMTVKIHRGQVTRKMKASSVPQLTRMADRLRDAIRQSQRQPDLITSLSQ
jgi:FixJ family two-component response regulator